MDSLDPGTHAAAHRSLVVAVDGPSGSGKSTVSRAVARRLGLRYLDTGATYRAVTLAVLAAGVDPHDGEAVARLCADLDFVVGTDPSSPQISVNGVAVGRQIRSREVSAEVSAVSAVPAVRTRLVALQRSIIGAGGIVVEGRDIGTVVVPDAKVKIFLTAAGETRAQRRATDPEYAASAPAASQFAATAVDTTPAAAPDLVAVAQAEMDRRDRLDSGRAMSPLTQARDALELDSTHLDVDEVVEAVLRCCAAVAAATGPAGRDNRQ